MGRLLITLGIVFLAAGLLVTLLGRTGLPFGRLPGDLSYRGKHVTVFAPLGTSILVSIVLSLVLYVVSHLRR